MACRFGREGVPETADNRRVIDFEIYGIPLFCLEGVMIKWKRATVNKPVVMAVCRNCKRPLIRDLNKGEICPKCRK